MKKEKLTKKEQAMIPVIRQKWLDMMFKTRQVDEQGIRDGVKWLYSFCKLKEPIVIIVDSPYGAQYAANILKTLEGKSSDQVRDQVWDQVWAQVGDQVRDQVGDQVWDQVWAQVGDQVRAQVWAQVWAQVGAQVRDQVRDQVWDQVGDQVWDQVRAQVGAQVWAQVGDQVGAQVWAQVGAQVWAQVGAQVWDQVRDQVWDQVGDQKLEWFNFSSYGDCADYGWLAFYEYWSSIGVLKEHEGLQNFTKLIQSGVFSMIQLEGVCIVSTVPKTLYRDTQTRLHNPEGYAIEWGDGYSQHYLYGVHIPLELFTQWKAGMSVQEILKIENQEHRSVLLRATGYETILDHVEYRVLEEYTYPDSTMTEKVIELNLGDEVDGTWARFIQCACWSTQRPYMLRVDPRDDSTKTVHGAQAWLANQRADQFILASQT